MLLKKTFIFRELGCLRKTMANFCAQKPSENYETLTNQIGLSNQRDNIIDALV